MMPPFPQTDAQLMKTQADRLVKLRAALRAVVAVTEGDPSTAALFAHDLAKGALERDK